MSILDQALSLTQGNELTTAISEEITGTISLSALDDYVWQPGLNRMFQRLCHAWNLLLTMVRSMTRFVTELLAPHLRDLLIVQTGGENTHHSPVFCRNLALLKKICLK